MCEAAAIFVIVADEEDEEARRRRRGEVQLKSNGGVVVIEEEDDKRSSSSSRSRSNGGGGSVTEIDKKQVKMTPWEQHWNVIIIPRYDYNAPSSLLRPNSQHTGFLITCRIKREKSATKEAMSILEKYFGSSNKISATCLGGSATGTGDVKTMHVDSTPGKDNFSIKSQIAADDLIGESSLMEESGANGENVKLSLVKLTRSGLLLFIFPNDKPVDATSVVSNIFESLGNGSLQSPRWCHRIFPIQATCNLNEKDLHSVAKKLVQEFVNDKNNKLARPVKYAVAFNRRGETEVKPSKSSNCSREGAFLDRNKCFDIVGSAVKDVVPESIVDLGHPELSVLVELLPLVGVRSGSAMVAVSVLPPSFVVPKPKLSIKALLSATKMIDENL